MKPFNLEAALAGAPVVLRDGRKAYIVVDFRKFSDASVMWTREPLNLLMIICGAMWWCAKDSGAYQDNRFEHEYDIVGMYEGLHPCPKCGDTEHQMTATNDNTSVFCQECGHHRMDMGE